MRYLKIGVGFSPSLSTGDQADLAREAGPLGFGFASTAEGPGQTVSRDAFQMFLVRQQAARDIVPAVPRP